MTAQLWRARSVAQLNHSAVASQPAARFSCRFYIIFDWEWVRNEPGARAILSCFCLAFGHCSQFIWYFHFSVSRRRLTRGLISNNQGRSWNLEFRLFFLISPFFPHWSSLTDSDISKKHGCWNKPSRSRLPIQERSILQILQSSVRLQSNFFWKWI